MFSHIIDLAPDFVDWLARRGNYDDIPDNLIELDREYTKEQLQHQHKVDWAVFDSALKTCINQLWSWYEVTSFTPTTPGGEGGKKDDDTHNGVIGIRDKELKTNFKIVNDPTPPPDVKAWLKQIGARGATDPANPFWTYAYPQAGTKPRPGELRYPELFGAHAMNYVRVQVHEAGAALSIIRNWHD